MKQVYTILIIAGVAANLVLFAFYDKSVYAFGPAVFWVIAAHIMLRYGWKSSQLFRSVKRTNPELYKEHTFGKWNLKSGRTLRDPVFLNALTPEEQELAEEAKEGFKHLFVCFALFAVSSFMVVLL